jgi:bifunctional isochorismate lyase/aryl carrier protein
MGLPAIAPYPMPGEAELPPSRVGWALDPARAVLLVHDMQRYFLDAFDTTREPVVELVANIAALRSRCRALGVPVVFSAQPGGQSLDERGLLQDWWGDGPGPGEDHTAIVDALAPAPGDEVLTKWRYSAFVRTDLRERLRASGRDQLVITGIYAHIGCLMTAADAFMHEIQPFLVADAIADFSADEHRMALRWAAARCAVTTSTRQALDALAERDRRVAPARPATAAAAREAVR